MSELCWPVVKIKKFNCRLENNRVTTWTFWGHVTSSVTWPFDSQWATSYGWSIATMHLSCTFMEIWSFKCCTDACTDGWMDERTFRWLNTLSNAIALHWTDNKHSNWCLFNRTQAQRRLLHSRWMISAITKQQLLLLLTSIIDKPLAKKS